MGGMGRVKRNYPTGFAYGGSYTLRAVVHCLMAEGRAMLTAEISHRIGKTPSATANVLIGNPDIFVREAKVQVNQKQKPQVLWAAWEW